VIRHQSAMIVSIYIKIRASFFYYGSRNRKLSLSSKLRTDSFMSMWCQILFTEKNAKNLQNEVKRDYLQSSPIKHLPDHNCEASAAEDRRHPGTVNRQLASGKQKVIIKQKYRRISVTFCWFCVQNIFYNRLRFKVLKHKSCRGGHFFPDTV